MPRSATKLAGMRKKPVSRLALKFVENLIFSSERERERGQGSIIRLAVVDTEDS